MTHILATKIYHYLFDNTIIAKFINEDELIYDIEDILYSLNISNTLNQDNLILIADTIYESILPNNIVANEEDINNLADFICKSMK